MTEEHPIPVEHLPEAGAIVEPEAPATEADLMKQLDIAMKSGDFKAVAKVASAVDKLRKSQEQTEREAKEAVLATITEKVKSIIAKALKPIVDAGELDQADGIWYSNDFGEKLVTCRLVKTAPRKAGTGGGQGGAGKKFSVTTNDLLAKFGTQEHKDGISFNQAYESNTDGNFRYAIRQKLLKLGGYI